MTKATCAGGTSTGGSEASRFQRANPSGLRSAAGDSESATRGSSEPTNRRRGGTSSSHLPSPPHTPSQTHTPHLKVSRDDWEFTGFCRCSARAVSSLGRTLLTPGGSWGAEVYGTGIGEVPGCCFSPREGKPSLRLHPPEEHLLPTVLAQALVA